MGSNEINKIQTQIDTKSVEMWFDTESQAWKFCVKEWRLDHWEPLSSAECKVEKVIRSFYLDEIKYLRTIQSKKELERSNEETV